MAVVADKLLDLQKQLENVMGDDTLAGEIKEKIRVEEEKRANYKVITCVIYVIKHYCVFLDFDFTDMHSLPHGEQNVRQAFQMC